jgi:hypothetical protein
LNGERWLAIDLGKSANNNSKEPSIEFPRPHLTDSPFPLPLFPFALSSPPYSWRSHVLIAKCKAFSSDENQWFILAVNSRESLMGTITGML